MSSIEQSSFPTDDTVNRSKSHGGYSYVEPKLNEIGPRDSRSIMRRSLMSRTTDHELLAIPHLESQRISDRLRLEYYYLKNNFRGAPRPRTAIKVSAMDDSDRCSYPWISWPFKEFAKEFIYEDELFSRRSWKNDSLNLVVALPSNGRFRAADSRRRYVAGSRGHHQADRERAAQCG